MLKIDLHIHTIASLHAISTFNEIAVYASKKKLKVIGISDHGPSLNATNTHFVYFQTLLRNLPKKLYGVRILSGVEANIVDEYGSLDLADEILSNLDYVMAAIHLGNQYVDKGEEINTKAMVNAMNNKYLKVLTHPYFDHDFKVDIKKISELACRKNILLEVNISVFKKYKFANDKQYLKNLKIMIGVVKKHKMKVIVNSDAHSMWEVGDDALLKRYKKEIGLTDDMIINNYPKELEKVLGVKF